MNKIIIFIFFCFLFPITYSILPEYGNVTINEEVYNQPFLGGFNKPKIQWVDWDNDQIEELFILDEDGSIRFYQKSYNSQNYELIDNNFLEISNISWFYIADFDLDDEFEIIVQDTNNINQMVMFDIINNDLIERGTIYDNTSYPVESDGVMTPTFCDIDNDGDLDFFTGNMIGTISFYENIGLDDNIPIFDLITTFWEEIYIVGPSQSRHGASAITFVDIDNDNDYDLSWGDYYQQSLYIIINNGSAYEPAMDNINIIFEYPPENPIYSAGLNMPTFTDIDNDGDKDLFVTVLSGAYGYQLRNNFYFFESENTNYILQTTDFIKTIDLLSDVAPSFIDIDNDDKIDMFIGTDFDPSDFPWAGKINYFQNSTNEESDEKSWVLISDDLLEQDIGNNLVVDFKDIDNDTDYDMFIGDFNGFIQFFENIGDGNNPVFTYVENLENIDMSGYSIPCLADIDNDNDYDLFIGQLNGSISFYENNGGEFNYSFNLVTENFENINVGSRSAPDIIDLDGDGDLDMVVGSQIGQIFYYENIGDANNYNFEYNESVDFPFLGRNSNPEFLNNKELIVGLSTGGLYYLTACNHPDINSDNQVNITDLLIIVTFITEFTGFTHDEKLCDYDLNIDGIINIVDIISLINIIINRL